MVENRIIKRILLIILIIAGISMVVSAQDAVGMITYLEGIVDIHRDGEIIELFDNDVGMEVYNQDLIETGDDGILEVEMITYRNSGTKVVVSENTAFFFEISGGSRGTKATLPMLSGSLAFKVQKLAGNEELNVQTGTAVMGVRGTEFEVVSAPEGSVLVVCVEGQVACEDDNNRQQLAQAGRVVEKRSGERIRKVDVDVGDERLYKEFWVGQREQVFKAGAPTFIRAYSQQYLSLQPQFAEAYQKVIANRDLLLRYGQESGGNNGVNADLMMIYSNVSKDLIPARGIFVLFEQVFYSVKVLEKYHSQGIGISQISRRLSSVDFFNEFNAYQSGVAAQLATMHYMFKLFTNMAEKASPAGSMMGDIFSSGNNPLGSSGAPSGTVPNSSF
ncbi:MAG: FecR domain-containing protein [Spirochaetales bacterium]|nr:FecR domain-containing protein [Spirochaetales bacterium]